MVWRNSNFNFLKKLNKKLVISNVYFKHNSIYCEFYTGVDNIRFDGKIVLTEDLKSKITELIKHGTSKNVLDYIWKNVVHIAECGLSPPPLVLLGVQDEYAQ